MKANTQQLDLWARARAAEFHHLQASAPGQRQWPAPPPPAPPTLYGAPGCQTRRPRRKAPTAARRPPPAPRPPPPAGPVTKRSCDVSNTALRNQSHSAYRSVYFPDLVHKRCEHPVEQSSSGFVLEFGTTGGTAGARIQRKRKRKHREAGVRLRRRCAAGPGAGAALTAAAAAGIGTRNAARLPDLRQHGLGLRVAVDAVGALECSRPRPQRCADGRQPASRRWQGYQYEEDLCRRRFGVEAAMKSRNRGSLQRAVL